MQSSPAEAAASAAQSRYRAGRRRLPRGHLRTQRGRPGTNGRRDRIAGRKALAIRADATEDADAAHIVDGVVQAWGTLQILVNNVGGGGDRAQQPVELGAQRSLAGGLRAAMRAPHSDLPCLPFRTWRRGGWGRVVTIASVKGFEGGGRPWYNMAKAAEISLMKSLALDANLVCAGITFNSIVPGRVVFPGSGWDLFRRDEPERYEERHEARHAHRPSRRPGRNRLRGGLRLLGTGQLRQRRRVRRGRRREPQVLTMPRCRPRCGPVRKIEPT